MIVLVVHLCISVTIISIQQAVNGYEVTFNYNCVQMPIKQTEVQSSDVLLLVSLFQYFNLPNVNQHSRFVLT